MGVGENERADLSEERDGRDASASGAKSKLPAALRSLRHRNYQLFFGGQFISLTGTWMQTLAQSWLVYKLTGSAVLLGFISFASQIPVFFLAPFGGIIADRFSRRRILIATQTAAMVLAFVLAALTLTGQVAVWHLFVLSGLLGIIGAIDIPTRQAFVIDLVGKEDLMNAIALNSSMFNGTRIVGPATAGLLVATIGEGWCFFANAVSYVAVIGGLTLMNVRPPERVEPQRGTALENVIEGFRFVVKPGPIRAILLLIGAISLLGTPYAVLMPIFADKILGGGASGLGILMCASGVGALLGALVLVMRRGVQGLGRWVAFSSAGFGLSLILFSSSRSFWFSAALLLPVGFSLMLQMASSNTLIQAMVPDNLRGRVMAVYSMMFMGMAPLGAVIAGSLAQWLGAPGMVALGGAGCILGAIVFRQRMPAFAGEARRLLGVLQIPGAGPVDDVTDGLTRSGRA